MIINILALCMLICFGLTLATIFDKKDKSTGVYSFIGFIVFLVLSVGYCMVAGC